MRWLHGIATHAARQGAQSADNRSRVAIAVEGNPGHWATAAGAGGDEPPVAGRGLWRVGALDVGDEIVTQGATKDCTRRAPRGLTACDRFLACWGHCPASPSVSQPARART